MHKLQFRKTRNRAPERLRFVPASQTQGLEYKSQLRREREKERERERRKKVKETQEI
jgi:hypothetical protein